MWPTWTFPTWLWKMSLSFSYSSSPWLSSLLAPCSMPYHYLRQVGVAVVFLYFVLFSFFFFFISFCSSSFAAWVNRGIVNIPSSLFLHWLDAIRSYLIMWKKKKSSSAFVLSLSLSQKVRTCSIVFWSCCVMPSACLGTVFASWSGTIAAWWGWSWQVNTTHDSLLCRWMDTLLWNRELGWPPDSSQQTHKHTVLNCQGELCACDWAEWIMFGFKAFCWIQRASLKHMQTSCLHRLIYQS